MMLVRPGSQEPLIPLAIGPSLLHATTARPTQPSGEQGTSATRAATNERRTRDAVMDLLRCECATMRSQGLHACVLFRALSCSVPAFSNPVLLCIGSKQTDSILEDIT